MTATRALTPVGRLWYRRRTMPPATDDIVAHALAEIRARIDDTDRKLLRLLEPLIEQAEQLAVGVVDAGADLGERVRDDVIGCWWHCAATVPKAAHGRQGPRSCHARQLCNMRY